jgi:hypothetical protein
VSLYPAQVKSGERPMVRSSSSIARKTRVGVELSLTSGT